ncbi:hypothetical protein AB0E67_35045 [Streptomyces sp. NPDC032161]|uniref:hypothetical protein n=1 Tax=unclassified Streptomyces TaxID=2593676 RepID=UPI0033F7863B
MLRVNAAGQVRSWLTDQDDAADTLRKDEPGVVAVRLTSGLELDFAANDEPSLPAPAAERHQAMIERPHA